MRKFNIFSIFITSFAIWSSYYSAKFLLPIHLSGSTNNLALISFVSSASGLVAAFLRFPVGILSDKYNARKAYIRFSIFVMFISLLLIIFTKSIFAYLLLSFCAGFITSNYVIFDLLFSKNMASNLILAVSTLTFADLLAEILVDKFLAIFMQHTFADFQYYFAIFLLGVALLFSFIFKDDKLSKNENQSFRDIISHISDSFLWLLIGLAVIIVFVKYLTIKLALSFIIKNAFHSKQLIVSLRADTTIAFDILHCIAGYLAAFSVAKKILKERTIILVGVILVVLTNMITMISTDYNLIVIMTGLNGFGVGLAYITVLSLSMNGVPLSKRGARMGILQSMYMFFGVFLGPTIASLFGSTTNVISIYYIATVAMMLCVPMLYLKVFNKKNKEA